MVVIQIKKGDTDGFLFEAPSSTSNDEVTREIVSFILLWICFERL